MISFTSSMTYHLYTEAADMRKDIDGYYEYSFKRGFDSRSNNLNIETCIQPLLAFLGKYKDANRSKTAVFETKSLYLEAYEKVKARHVLFVSCLFAALTEIKNENHVEQQISANAASLEAMQVCRFVYVNVVQWINVERYAIRTINHLCVQSCRCL